MNSLGIYFGPKVISIVETKGSKLINHAQLPQSTITSGDLEEKVPDEVRLIEIIALFKAELRKNKIEAKQVSLCLSGKDLIIRTFEMPLLPREELQNAINFEAKKYIPFKVEDLVSDFQLEYDKLSRSNLVLFMGIKKEIMERYIAIINQLNMKISRIEYSGFSVLRALKAAGVVGRGVVGVIAVDMVGQDEAIFVVLENGLPLFSRDITLSQEPGDFISPQEAGDASVILEKLKTEMRISLDYYKRKFPSKNIQKIILVSDQEHRRDFENLISDIGLSPQFVDMGKNTGRQAVFSLGLVKGYGVSLAKTINTKVKLNVLAVKAKARASKDRAVQDEIFTIFQGLRIDYGVIAVAVLICLVTFGFGLYRTQLLKRELSEVILARQGSGDVASPDASYDGLVAIRDKYKNKLTELDNLVRNELLITEPLNVIPKAMPQGMWLNGVAFKKNEENKAELILEGSVYLDNGDREFKSVNSFLNSLKSNPYFAARFNYINIVSLNRGSVEGYSVTNFLVSCRNFQEKR
ncbi:MAG TPA: pilus assembly protein PilM [Candidatus Margulisiibacteriota bacterium]|nr:pilus assembly protein PilM [Candidatus Margulisiibacteriota bacterium]